MIYTNGSHTTKTFYGVTFNPGETKQVPGYINDPSFTLSSVRKEPPKRVKRRRKSAESEVVESTVAEKAVEVVLANDSVDNNSENTENKTEEEVK